MLGAVLQGPDSKLELVQKLLASTVQCCHHPVSPSEDKGMRKLLFVCVCELGCNLVCIGCQTMPLGKIKPIFQIHSVPPLGCGSFICFFVRCALAHMSGRPILKLLRWTWGQGRSLLCVSYHAERKMHGKMCPGMHPHTPVLVQLK